ncbi:OstA-like protein [Flavobacterium sp.]|uniref:OstA-like protein n=1 Tax=Flavobacterium sp. TaxID=239 RepID=UPI0025BE7ACC|nr:OstA-like protein [Flavobacterium sp.]
MKKYLYIIASLIISQVALAQGKILEKEALNEPTTRPNQKGKINFIHSDFIDRNESEIPGAIIYAGNIQVEHNGANIFCNKAYYFYDEEYIKAFGNVRITQGDTINMTSKYAEYNGKTETAFATGDVLMTSPDSKLVTDTVYLNRKIQQAYYNSYGTITNEDNILKSKSGRYYINQKKYAFKTAVTVTNPKCVIKTNNLDFYDNSGHAYVYGPSTITSKTDVIYTENGFYDTKNDIGKLKGKSNINYNNKKIEGDLIDYDRKKNYSKAVNNVKITDTLNNMIARGHYAELYRNIRGTKQDSMFITKKALVSTLVDKKTNDSLHLHGKRILVTGAPEDRTIRAFNNVRFIKSDMSGKCDSIHSNNKNALTKLIGRPVIWSQDSQMTGDEIHLIGNNKTEQLDSLKVLNNAFLIQKDTIGNGFNQVKGQFLYGKLRDNKLYEVDLVKNTEKIYYMYDENNDLVGIDKGVSSKINMQLENSQIVAITSLINPESETYPEDKYPENARKLRGFIWRIDEKISSKDDLFPAEELAFDQKVQEEKKKNEKAEAKPMEVLKETLNYDKKEKKEIKKKEKKK